MKAEITFLKSSSKTSDQRPLLVMIPGGPGLSSESIRSLDILKRNFDLAYVDYGGTAKSKKIESITFDVASDAIEQALTEIKRPIVLIGHSFGGILAASLSIWSSTKIVGLVCLATPLSNQSLTESGEKYSTNKTPALLKAEQDWNKNPSKDTFRKWFAECDSLFFAEKNHNLGRKLMLADPVAHEIFLGIRNNVPKDMDQFAYPSGFKKISIAGALDMMMSAETLKQDAKKFGFKFVEIEDAGHFVQFDQPEAVAQVIENNFI